MSLAKLWSIELLSNGVIVVDQFTKEQIVNAIRTAHNRNEHSIVEIKDHEGHNHGFPTDAVIMWYDDPEAIAEILDMQKRVE